MYLVEIILAAGLAEIISAAKKIAVASKGSSIIDVSTKAPAKAAVCISAMTVVSVNMYMAAKESTAFY